MCKILCAVSDTLGCGYYRIIYPYNELKKQYNYDITTTLIFKEEEIDKHDIIVLQRQNDTRILNFFKEYKKNNGKAKIIYELDDLFHEIPSYNPCIRHYPKDGIKLKNMTEFLELADLLTVTTEGLRNEFLKYNKNIFVFENYIPRYVFGDVANNEPKDEIRIGWAGSCTHLEDIKLLIEPLTSLFKEDDRLKLVLIGADYINLFPGIPQHRKEFIQGTLPKKEEYQKTLQEICDSSTSINFLNLLVNENYKYDAVSQYYKILKDANIHIGLAPLAENKFNRCKSSIKLKEYIAAGIPYVASPLSDYIKFSSMDYYKAFKIGGGFIASDARDWKKYIKVIIENRDKFLENQNKIRENIFLEDNIHILHNKLLQIVGGEM